jgi:hypothetical protein
MSNNMMSPLPTFTLESLVTDGQWVAAQNNSRRKADAKADEKKRPSSTDPSTKDSKPTL